MKKIVFLAVIVMLLMTGISYAQLVECTGDKYVIKCYAKAAAAAAVYTPKKIAYPYTGMWLCAAQNKPGATAPTAAWDYTLTNDFGADLLGTAGMNRSETATEIVYPIVDANTTQRACVPVRGNNLTLTISGNSVNAADMYIELWFESK